MANAFNEKNDFALRRMNCDFHISDSVDHIEFDTRDYVERAKAAHVQYICMMGQSPLGGCFYTPRKVGRRHPGLKQDILEEMVPLCHDNGIKIATYYNYRNNKFAGSEAQPEWFQILKDGKVDKDGRSALFCINTPYRDYVIAQLCEMATYYALDGFWFDNIGAECYCEYCRAMYQEMFGEKMKLPWEEEVPLRDQVRWDRMQIESDRKFIQAVIAKIRPIRPNLELFWNGSGSYINRRTSSKDMIKYAACVSTEMHHPRFMGGSLGNRYMRNLGRPYERFVPECLASWTDFTINTENTLKTMAALIIANGGAMSLCSVPCPNGMNAGRQWPASWEIIGNVLGFIKEREGLVKGAKPVRDIAVIYENDDIDMKLAIGRAYGKSTGGNAERMGTGTMLLRDHQQVDIVNPDFETAIADFDKYNLIILPDLTHVSDGMAVMIRERVRAGANVIATYRTGLYHDFEMQSNYVLADLFGVDFDRISPYTHIYLNITESKLKTGIPDQPVLIDGRYPNNEPLERSCYVRPHEGTAVLATYVEPYGEHDPATQRRRVSRFHSHPYKLTDIPAITMKQYGKGHCIYMGFPTGVAQHFMKSPWLERVFINAARMVNSPVMDIQAPSFVDANLMEKDDAYILHLIPCLLQADSKFIEDEYVLADIRCRLRLPSPISVECWDTAVEWTYTAGCVDIRLPKLSGPTMIVIKKKG